MAARPIGFGPAVQQFVSGTPPQKAPKVGQAKPSVPNRLESGNVIRAQAAAGNLPAVIPKRALPTVIRGRISVPSRGTGRPFMFNPNEINDGKAISWGSVEVPGASHPVYQFGAGGERLITFDLYIDGDRGRFGRSPRDGQDKGDMITGQLGLSIRDELHWYRSLEYPSEYGQSFQQVSPPIVLFTFGELYNNVPCIVKKADWKVNYWVPGPSGPVPVRATIPIILGEAVSRSQTATDVLSAAGLTAYEF